MRGVNRLLAAAVLVALIAAGFIAGYGYGQRSQAATSTRAQGHRLLDEIVGHIRETYIDRNVDEQKLFFGAAKGMLEALGDPYSGFFDPEANQLMRQDFQGVFFGVGMFIEVDKAGKLIVVQPIEGTPAARAGLRAGDHITKINEKPTEGMTSQEAAVRIRGPKGTTVRLTIRRGDNVFEFNIVRDRIEVVGGEGPGSLDAATRSALRQLGIGYIKLTLFNERTVKTFDRLFDEARRSGARGLILDLRNNPGGLLESSLELADRFVPAGQPLVHTVDRNGRRATEQATGRPKVGMPAIVLVNEFSASAAEIVAGALQDSGVATLIGVKTFGKGVIQTIFNLSLNSGVSITTAKYLTPKGRDIHTKGLVPDMTVGQTEEALREQLRGRSEAEVEQRVMQMKASQLQQAIEILRRKMSRSDLQPFAPSRARARLAAA